MPSSACDWSSDVCSSDRSEEHTSELQSRSDLVCRLLLEKKKKTLTLPIRKEDQMSKIQKVSWNVRPHLLQKKAKLTTLNKRGRKSMADSKNVKQKYTLVC